MIKIRLPTVCAYPCHAPLSGFARFALIIITVHYCSLLNERVAAAAAVTATAAMSLWIVAKCFGIFCVGFAACPMGHFQSVTNIWLGQPQQKQTSGHVNMRDR